MEAPRMIKKLFVEETHKHPVTTYNTTAPVGHVEWIQQVCSKISIDLMMSTDW